ncbi:MAG TPA: TniQ family protein [Coleofasciculaceae cyanobacterium]
MLDEELTTFERLDLTMPIISECSHLYHLQPIGIETAYVESLVSYAARLANTHAVPFWMLIQKVLFAPEEQSLQRVAEIDVRRLLFNELRTSQEVKRYCLNFSRWLDGNHKDAANLIRAFESATRHQNLDVLTMLAWKGILPSNGLLRREQAWCPFCYQEWRETQQPIYQPLLWLLEVIYVCPHHHRRLRSGCQHCEKSWTGVYSYWQPGYCPGCKNWLGLKLEESDHFKVMKEELQWQLWVVQMVTELLVVTSQFAERNLRVKDRTFFTREFRSRARCLAEPEKLQFLNLMNIHRISTKTLKELNNDLLLLLKTQPPTLDWILKLCYCTKIPLLNLLTEETNFAH